MGDVDVTIGVNVTLYRLRRNNCHMVYWKTEVLLWLLLFQDIFLLFKKFIIGLFYPQSHGSGTMGLWNDLLLVRGLSKLIMSDNPIMIYPPRI